MAKQRKLWVLGALILAVGGVTMASNMGFKLTPNFNAGGQQFTLSLPINSNYVTLKDLYDDIHTSCGATMNAGKVERIVPSVGGKTRVSWDINGGPGFVIPVNKTEGYIVATGSGACTTAVVVGSHDPAYPYSFTSPGLQYLVSIPYHTTATTLQDLFNQIGMAGTSGKVERIVPSVGGKTRVFWDTNGGPGFPIPVTIGEAYIVVVGSPTTWNPAHY